MQLSMRYDHIDGKKLIFLLCTLFFGLTLQAQNQDFSRVKSKYDFKTEATDQLEELIKSKDYDQGLSFVNQKLSPLLKSEDYEQVVFLLERKAYILRRLERFSEAESAATEAIELAKKRLGLRHILLAKSYFMRGQIEHRRREFYTASSNFDTAQVIYEKSFQYDSTMYESIIDYKYYAYSYAQQNIDTLKKYLDIRYNTILSNPYSTPHDIIYLLNDFPSLYRENGDFDEALRYSIAEVAYANENNKDVTLEDHVSSYYNLIYTLYFLKRYDLALDICNDILIKYHNDPRYEKATNVIDILSLKPILLASLNQYENALHSYFDLLKILEDSKIDYELEFLVQQQINIASCYLELGIEDQAKRYLHLAMANIISTSKLPDKQAEYLYSILGSYYKSNGDTFNSFMSYDSSIRNGIPEYFSDKPLNFPEIQDQKVSFMTLLGLKNKASSLMKLFEDGWADSLAILNSTKDYVISTHEILMTRRKELMRSEGKLFLSSNFKGLYELGLQASYLLVQNGQKQEGINTAIQILQMSKSILFLEQAGEFEEINRSNIPLSLKKEYYSLNNTSKNLNTAFNQKLNFQNVTSDTIKFLNSQILKNNKSLLQIKDSIYDIIREDIEKSDENRTELDEGFIGTNSVTIEYFVGEEVIYILGRSKSSDVFLMVDITEELKKSIQSIMEQISEQPKFSGYDNVVSKFSETSNLIYEYLLAPVLNRIEGEIKSITIVPDDFLSQLPFEVLVTSKIDKNVSFHNLPYLIKSYKINYLLSSVKKTKEYRKVASKGILGIGYSTDRLSKNSITGLPGTDREIKQLQSQFDGDYYLGYDATKSLFLEKAKDFDILHIAIHGETDGAGKYNARLIFNGKDSVLNTEDLYLANLKARLAILSACESGTGELNRGEGSFSIARGFALVGVPSILMSLWNVNDKVTPEIMMSFHEFLALGYDTSESLYMSKLSYLEKSDNYTSHPYYWSPFVTLGEPIQLYSKRTNSAHIALTVAISFLIICFLLIILINKKRREAI